MNAKEHSELKKTTKQKEKCIQYEQQVKRYTFLVPSLYQCSYSSSKFRYRNNDHTHEIVHTPYSYKKENGTRNILKYLYIV